jgi:hypothetical protein
MEFAIRPILDGSILWIICLIPADFTRRCYNFVRRATTTNTPKTRRANRQKDLFQRPCDFPQASIEASPTLQLAPGQRNNGAEGLL